MNGTFRITLKSDLCVASGYSFAGVIDTDAVFDEFGIPYIPARRIKGCLREAAELIEIKEIDRMFGRSGDNHPGSLYISDAMIENYEEVKKECQTAMATGAITREEIADAFSYVRGQTKIDEQSGIKADNTLRYIRVVKQKSPIENGNMVFLSEIRFDDDQKDDLENAAKALKNIGMNRNRGLGSVHCEFIEAKNNHEEPSKPYSINENGDTLFYVIVNTDLLMLSGNREDISETYISGKAVLGALAATYLRKSGNKSEDEEFKELFLNDSTWFSNAYPVELDGERCYPVPLYIKELKKTKRAVNTLKMKERELHTDGSVQNKGGTEPAKHEEVTDPYDPRDGNQPKKLKGKYWNYRNNKKLEVRTEVVYHHSRHKKGKEGGLYTLEVIPRGSYFAGEIHGSVKNIEILSTLLDSADLRFGKSKSAQYGNCKLVTPKTNNAAQSSAGFSGKIVVTLLSDAVFCDKNGYTTEFNKVSKRIMEELGIPDSSEVCKEKCVYETVVRTGYNTQWNLSNPFIPAIAAGSAFTFDLGDQSVQFNTDGRFGEYNREGCGEYRIDALADMQEHPGGEDAKSEKIPKACVPETGEETDYRYIGNIVNRLRREKQLEAAVKTFGNRVICGEANIGRLTLMLKESVQEHINSANEIMNEFKNRIDSIKSERAKKEASSFYNAINKTEIDENMKPQLAMRLLINAKYEKRKNRNG